MRLPGLSLGPNVTYVLLGFILFSGGYFCCDGILRSGSGHEPMPVLCHKWFCCTATTCRSVNYCHDFIVIVAAITSHFVHVLVCTFLKDTVHHRWKISVSDWCPSWPSRTMNRHTKVLGCRLQNEVADMCGGCALHAKGHCVDWNIVATQKDVWDTDMFGPSVSKKNTCWCKVTLCTQLPGVV